MVTSLHALASQAGVGILQAGGSAVDAAIAAVLSVVYPHMTSVGGDAFWLIYDARAGAVCSLEAAGRGGGSHDRLVLGSWAPRDPDPRHRARHPDRSRRGRWLVRGPRGLRPAAALHRPGGGRALRASQGLSVLQALRLLEPYDIGALPYLGADHVHLLVQAKQIAFHDRDRFVADPDFVPVPVERLRSPAYLDERRRLMDRARARPWDRVPSEGSLAGDTVYVAAVDAEGNAVSLIQSLYFDFGSGVVAGKTGRGAPEPRRLFLVGSGPPQPPRARQAAAAHAIASLAFKDGRPWQVLGCMGADGQPQIHLQAYTAIIDFGLDIQRAVEAPRWLAGCFAIGDPRALLNLEGRFPESTFAELARRGHAINRWEAWNERAGHAHGITIDPASGVLAGAADPRSDGATIGY